MKKPIFLIPIFLMGCTNLPPTDLKPYTKETHIIEKYTIENASPKSSCEYTDINLFKDIPVIPRVDPITTNDKLTGEYLVNYIKDLRDYIKLKDAFILNGCK